MPDRCRVAQDDSNSLFAYAVCAASDACTKVWVCEVDKVQGITGFSLPTVDFDQTFTLNCYRTAIANEPADGICYKITEISCSRAPVSCLDISREIHEARPPSSRATATASSV